MKKNVTLIYLAILFSLGISKIEAQPILDNTYSGDGYLLSNVSPSDNDFARTVLVQSNGRILTGGNSFNNIGYSDIRIIRTKPNGNMDNTFGVAGIATIPGGFFTDMALLPNGKIIVAGSGVGPTNVNNFIVYRLTKNGALDNTFGIGGSVEVNIPYQGMICYDVIIQPDGKILLGGYVGGYANNDMLIVRLKANGNLDNTFGTAGKFIFLQESKNSECKQLALQTDGKIIAAGSIDTLLFFAFLHYDFAAIRLSTIGTLDNTFGVGGVARANKGTLDMGSSVAVLSDGRIVLGGNSNYLGNVQFAALGLLSNGSYDPSFGTGGWTFLDFYGASAYCNAMLAEPDNDLIMAGMASTYDGVSFISSIAMAKLISNGTPDNTFGVSGIDTSFYNISSKSCNDIALQSDNKIVIGGNQYIGDASLYLTARYTNSAAFMKSLESIAESDLNIYPNPNNGNFEINFSNAFQDEITINIVNQIGNVVYAEIITAQDIDFRHSVALDANLARGIYFVTVRSGNNIKSTKLIIQ